MPHRPVRVMRMLLVMLLTLVVLVLAGAAGFILALQVTEFDPPASSALAIDVPEEVSYGILEEGVDIRILTWNLGYASLSATEDFVMDGGVKGRMDSLEEVEANINGISAVLSAQNADLVFLQEVDEGSDRSYNTLQYTHYAELLAMASVFGVNYRCIFVPFPFEIGQMMGHVESGIVTFSRFAIDAATREQLPGSFSWPLRLANLKRCMVVTRLDVAGTDKQLVLVNVHLSAYDDGTMRVQETEALRVLVAAEYDAGNYVVIGGDFNQTFPAAAAFDPIVETWDYVYPLKDPSFWEAFALDGAWFTEHGWSYGVDITTPTCRLLNHPLDPDEAGNQYYVIDGFIVSPNVSIQSVTTLDLDFTYSDHNPVVLVVQLS